MYILKNAYKSIARTKGRNILIGIVICIIGVACTLGLAINSASQEIVKSQKESSEVSATFSVDREALRKNMTTIGTRITVESISSDKIEEYAKSEHVKELRIRSNIGLNSSSITAASSDSFFEKNVKEDDSSAENRPIRMEFGKNPNSSVRSDFQLTGYNTSSAMSEFVSGTYKIKSGAIVDVTSDTYECVINSELAEENSLIIGSKITFTNPNKVAETYEFVVKGIYEDTTKSDETANIFSNSANTIIITGKSVDKIVKNSELDDTTKLVANTVPTIILEGVDSVDEFTKEVTTKGLPANYVLSTNEDTVSEALKPMQNLTNFTKIFLILVLVIGAVILVILNMINIRERKYEIGVLRAIGMKKTFVLSQFVIELLIVTIIAISIGTAIGSALSVPAANYMLKNEIATAKEQSETIDSNFGGQMGMGPGGARAIQGLFKSNANTKYIEQINAIVDMKVVSQILLIGLSLTIISSSISMVAISRYNPLKILSSRS